MSYILVDIASNEMVDGPFDDKPTPGDGQRVVPALLGFPDTCRWSAVGDGFTDIEVPPDQASTAPTRLEMLIDTLVQTGVLTNSDASVILATPEG